MITLEQLITRVEQRLLLAAGLNVQIHAEDTFVEMARHAYTVCADDLWLDDYLEIETWTLDGVNGYVVENIEDKLRKFIDIQYVYYDNDTQPMPRMNAATNPTTIKRRSLRAIPKTNANAAKRFQVYPKDTTGPVTVVYRTRMDDTAWDTADPEMEIPMDSELMVLATTFDYLSSDGSNIDDANKVQAMYQRRLAQIQKNEWKTPLAKRPLDSSMHPNQWEEC